MIGALVFLGCPWRAMLRLAGGDGNAILGLLGLIFGIFIGTRFLKSGYTLGREGKSYPTVGLLLPGIMILFFILMLIFPQVQGQLKSDIQLFHGAPDAPAVDIAPANALAFAVDTWSMTRLDRIPGAGTHGTAAWRIVTVNATPFPGVD